MRIFLLAMFIIFTLFIAVDLNNGTHVIAQAYDSLISQITFAKDAS